MSKKSRRRNKKILAMLALAGGAALAGRGKGMSGKETVSDAQKAHNFALTDSAPVIRKDVVANAAANAAANTGSNFQSRFKSKVGNKWMGPNEAAIAAANTPGHGTAVAPPGILNPYRAPRGTGPRRFSKGGSVKKARVTGVAKRGFGRALMKGKK